MKGFKGALIAIPIGLLIWAALGLMIAAGAKAEPVDNELDTVEKTYADTYHETTCGIVSQMFTNNVKANYDTIIGMLDAMTEDGLTPGSAMDVINYTVQTYCSEHQSDLVAVGAWARGDSETFGPVRTTRHGSTKVSGGVGGRVY